MKEILIELSKKQEELNMSDYTFSKKLGIPRTTWRAIRSGKRKIGVKTLQIILNTYPEMAILFVNKSNNSSKLGLLGTIKRMVTRNGNSRSKKELMPQM